MSRFNLLIDKVLREFTPERDAAGTQHSGATLHATGVVLPDATPASSGVPPSAEAVLWTLARFDEERGILVVRSRRLGCEVIFAAEEATIPAGEVRPVYRVQELRELLKANPDSEALERIHRVKSIFQGRVVKGEARP